MKKFLLSAGLVLASIAAQAQCEAAATLNENFSDFTITASNAFPQNCWSAIAAGYPSGVMIYTAQADDNQYATFYASTAVNVAGYLSTPEISTFDGDHQLSFSSWKLGQGGTIPAGTVTIQVGTMTDTADAATFVAVGDLITLGSTGTPETFDNIVIPSAAAGSHIVFKIIADTAHNAIAIDDVVWDEIPAPACEAVATLNENFSNFTITASNAFPQSCWSAIAAGYPSGVMIYTAQANDNQYATFYASTAVNVAGYLSTPEISTFDGSHQLSFSTWKLGQGGTIPAGTITIQVGTMTDTADAATFVAVGDLITVGNTGTPETFDNIVIPSAAAGSHIVFKIIADTAHNAIALDDVIWDEIPAADCAAVASFDENFDAFTGTEFPENCWSAIANGPLVYLDGEAGDNEAIFYSLFSANTAAYLITPEVSTIDGNHSLSFDALASGTITVQPGYITDAADATTFVAVGDVITLTSTNTTYNVPFAAITGNAHIAIQFTASDVHLAAMTDNYKWQTTAAVSTNTKSVFAVYPNPSSDKNITITNNTQQDGAVAIYSLTGAKVFEAKVSGAAQQLNLSGLSAGVYVVRFTSGNAAATQKLIIQ